MGRQHPTLFDTSPGGARRVTCTDLALCRPGCPECGGPLAEAVVAQPALFRHGGYGATRRSTWAICGACRWTLERETVEVRP